MSNPIRHYDWGSRTALAAMQGRPPSTHAEAELWMGAHPNGPSSLLLPDGPRLLTDLVRDDALTTLGAPVLERFGRRFPFLLKVLAVERTLSVQVHPGAEQAAEQFAAEDAAAVPAHSPVRTFVDPYAKPEFLYALTPFVALAGLREAQDAARLLGVLDLPALEPVRRILLAPGGATSAPGRGRVAEALRYLLQRPATEQAAISARAAASAAAASAAQAAAVDPQARQALDIVVRLATEHPGDVLVVAPLLLRLHVLPPGGTIFLPTGVPHAYVHGVAVEIMASSDNVLRAGLTTKHVAVEALLTALDPTADAHVGWPARAVAAGAGQVWTPPVPDFALARFELGGNRTLLVPPELAGPRIVLCTSGQISLGCDAATMELPAGSSAFLPPGPAATTLSGSGEAFVAAPGPVDAGSSVMRK